MYGFGGSYLDMLRQRLGGYPGGPIPPVMHPGMPFEGNYNPNPYKRGPMGGLNPPVMNPGMPFEGNYNPRGGYKGGMGFPNPLARLQPFLGGGRRKRPSLTRPY